ncbi:unnamed protein product [Arabidopsis thaliana]|uniref:Uncharacterized protein n=1 Tax=Arabidopsis thaliana TaxID=3702 RepID=A0A654FEG2_ARATH|nr:unnamed protein product [Arabidopsis thaliana]
MVLVNVHSDGQPIIINKDMLTWYLLSLKLRQKFQTKNQHSKPVQDPNLHGLPEVTRQNQDQNVQNHKQTHSESGKEVVEERPEETTGDSWVISIRDKLEQADRDDDTTIWGKLCIYRVPHYLQENDKKSYFPQTVSLGPYHHGKKRLRPMERHKWRALNKVLKRLKQRIEMYTNAMRELEEKARACYEGEPLKDFRDRLGTQNQTGIVAHVAVKFFDPLMPTGEALTKPDQSKLMNWLEKSLDTLGDKGELHCLDVFRRSLLQCSPTPNTRSLLKRLTRNTRVVDKRQQQLVHCVTELREAGVKFRKRKTDRFWDIEFKNGYLEIPKLLIHDGTKSLFSNLIAFEQCHIESSNHMTSYIIFMDNLINSSEDVSYLHYCGIIEHWLGSDSEVADLFNRLCQEVVFDPKDSHLSRLSGDVNRYYNRKWNVLKATLTHKYFNNPWAYFSFSAAVILLLLTLCQSFYAVYAYYKPNSKL